MSDFNPYAAAPSAPASAAPAPAGSNPYGAPAPATVSPYMAQPNDQRFGQPVPVNPNDQITRSDDLGWNNSHLANQQDQLADQSGAAQVGDAVKLSDGTHYQVTEEGQQLNSQFVNQVEQHFGAGQFDAMLQFASTLSQSEQASLERLVLSGDPASMRRAGQYVAQKMGGNAQNSRAAAQTQPQYQSQPPQHQPPTQYINGLSSAEFMAALDNLSRQGVYPGMAQYDAQYRQLVAARSAGKRNGR